MNLYIKEVSLENKPETVKEFLTIFFNNFDKLEGSPTDISTYYDKECTDIECDATIKHYFRTLTNLYYLVNTYYPNTSIEDIVLNIMQIFKENNYFLITIYCRDIQKCTIGFTSNIFYVRDRAFDEDDIKEMEDEFIWKDILNSLSIYNANDLKKYYETI